MDLNCLVARLWNWLIDPPGQHSPPTNHPHRAPAHWHYWHLISLRDKSKVVHATAAENVTCHIPLGQRLRQDLIDSSWFRIFLRVWLRVLHVSVHVLVFVFLRLSQCVFSYVFFLLFGVYAVESNVLPLAPPQKKEKKKKHLRQHILQLGYTTLDI